MFSYKAAAFIKANLQSKIKISAKRLIKYDVLANNGR